MESFSRYSLSGKTSLIIIAVWNRFRDTRCRGKLTWNYCGVESFSRYSLSGKTYFELLWCGIVLAILVFGEKLLATSVGPFLRYHY